MTTGERIKLARKGKNMSQKELAEKIGVSASMIGQYENGLRNPKVDTIQRIACALGIDWNQLVTFRKLTDSEMYRYRFLQFKSEEDRIAYFYSQLNTDGKLAASACFFRHLREDSLTEVADYVLSLAENPLYQREKTSEQDDQAQDTTDTQD